MEFTKKRKFEEVGNDHDSKVYKMHITDADIEENKVERWVPVVVRHHGSDYEKAVFEKYEVNNMSQVRNKKTGRVLSSNELGRIELRGNGKGQRFANYRLCLASFFPDDIPDDIGGYHVDHINGNTSDNRLCNLQWITPSEHNEKTMRRTFSTRKSLIEKMGKKVRIIAVKKGGNAGLVGNFYDSATCAANALKLTPQNVSLSAGQGCFVKNYKFEYVDEPLLEGEFFLPLGAYKVSNKGRIRMKSGKITTGSKRHRRHRCVKIKLPGDIKERSYLVHVLVWLAFNDRIPPGQVVMHNNTYNTLDDEGYERNWIEDLSLRSPHDNSRRLKKVRCVSNGEVYKSVAQAARDLGLNYGNVWNVCNGNQKSTGGMTFEYV